MLVKDYHVVYDHTVEETQINASHRHLCTQLLTKYFGYFRADIPLSSR